MSAGLSFKVASEAGEFEQIHRLNHRTFAEEIPQHRPEPGGSLVDRFHAENTYLICLRERVLVGMLAVRGRRPFSLDHKLENLDAFLPPGTRPCEVRLLAVEREYRGVRGGKVLSGLLGLLWQYAKEHGYDAGVISGTTRQLRLYTQLGFVAFGPLVGAADAQFQPMFVSMQSFEAAAGQFCKAELQQAEQRPPQRRPSQLRPPQPWQSEAPPALSFLPGPVPGSGEVRRAFERPAESHRSDAFRGAFEATQRLARELAQAGAVQFLMGTGTLANDVVAAQLSLLAGRGLVLSNGEFGERLIDHARRARLDFESVQLGWGEPLELGRRFADRSGNPAWLWCVHCETSTGVLNDLQELKRVCAARGIRLCVDCVSSLGAVPLDLRGVHLASGSSGKALRAYPGLALVFHHGAVEPAAQQLPRYLDLGSYAREGTPFSFSSNLLYALQAALTGVDWSRRFAESVERCAELRARLGALGFELVGAAAVSSPAVLTLALPAGKSSAQVGAALRRAGVLVSHESAYLRRRNWLQLCLMGELPRGAERAVVDALRQVCQG